VVVIEVSPGKARCGQVVEERFVSPRCKNSGLRIRDRKHSHRAADMVRRTAAKGVRVEIACDDDRTARHSIQQKFHLNTATACGAKNLEVDIGDRDRAT